VIELRFHANAEGFATPNAIGVLKSKKKCSVHCHNGDDDHDCGFLASLALRTEKALVSQAKATAGSGLRSDSRKRARANTAGDPVD